MESDTNFEWNPTPMIGDTPDAQQSFNYGGETYFDRGQNVDYLQGLDFGFDDSIYSGYAPGDEGMSTNPDLLSFLNDQFGQNWKTANMYGGSGGIGKHALFDSGGKQQAVQEGREPTNSGDLGAILGVLSGPISSGVAGVNPAASMGFTDAITQRIINQAITGAGTAAVTGGNPITGAVAGGAGAAIPGYNLAGMVGIENPATQNIINRGLSGGVNAALRGGNVLEGAAGAALPAAGGSMLSSLFGNSNQNMSYSPFEQDYNFMGPQEPSISDFLGTGQSPQMTPAPIGSGVSPVGDYFGTSPGEMPQFSSPMKQAQSASMGGGNNQQPISYSPTQQSTPNNFNNWSSGLGNLFGLLQANYQRRKAKQLAGGLESMFGPNSAYSQQLRSNLGRRDAASGRRRGNYGGREVELQAKLAEMNSRNAPAIMQAQQGQLGGLNAMFNNMLQLGRNPILQDWMSQLTQGQP